MFAPGEAEARYDGIDEGDVVSDYMLVNEAIVDVLDERDGVNEALKEAVQHQTRAFY